MTPQRKELVRMLAIGVGAAIIGTFVALQINWFPTQGSTAAGKIDTLYDWLLVASVPMFVLVMSVAIYSVVRFRARPGTPDDLDGAPIHGHTRLEIIWVTIPFLIVTALAVYAAVVLAKIEEHKPNELQVHVVGQQFTWHFEYNDHGRRFKSDVLYLPNNRPVKFNINTRDVLHSFWVPAFRLKIDAVPGQTDVIRVTPNRIGNYEVVCAELCGQGHATMRVKAFVVTPQRFRQIAASLGRRAAPTPAAGGGGAASPAKLAAQGKAVFTGEGGCGACHTLSDAGTSGQVGPKLNGIAARGKAFIKQSIETPNAFVEKGFPKNVMPQDFKARLGQAKVDALVQYLLQAGK